MITDTTMDDFLDRIVQAERKRNAEIRARILTRLRHAREEARRLAHAIGESDPTIRRVVLFGSVATGRVRTLDFDIDLAIEGGDVLQAWRIADASSFAVDVVDLNDVSPGFRAVVEQRGEVLYERATARA